MIEASDGIHMMDTIKWDESQADLTIYCDASLEGLSFVTPSLKLGFSGPMPTDSCLQMIFFFELLCVASTVLWASGIEPHIRRLWIFMDSLTASKFSIL